MVELENGKLCSYKGNYRSYLKQKKEAQTLREESLKKLENKEKHLKSFVERFGAKASKAKQAQARVKQLEKLEEEKKQFEDHDKSHKKPFFKDFDLKKTSRLIFELENLSVGYPGKSLKTFKLNVERGQRLAILGANGLGKTTLLKTLAGQLDSLSGSFKLCTKAEIAYFTQDQRDSLNPNHSVLEEILNIISNKTGDGGFGYDPYFIPSNSKRTFAEMGFKEKLTLSHRFEAFKILSTTQK